MKIANNIQEAIPMMISAVVSSDLIMLNALLDKFPKLIALKNKQDQNLLMLAAYFSEPSVFNYLVSVFVIANPCLDPEEVDNDNLTAYDWAVLGGNEFACSLLSNIVDPKEDFE